MTTHTNCSHPATKADRARCRRSKVATAHTVAITSKRIADKPGHEIEPCTCGGPVVTGLCTLCDRPANMMTALGLLLTA